MAPARALLACLALAAALAGPACCADANFVTFTDPLRSLARQLPFGTTGQMVGKRQGPLTPGASSLQRYANGLIAYQPNYGAHWIYPAATADLYLANKAALGSPERGSVAFPAAGASCAKSKGLAGWVTYFTGGGIVYTTSTNTAVMVTGPTYVKYLQMGDVFGALGPPQSRSFKGTGVSGPLATSFACGFIVEALSSSPYRPAYAMLDSSPITQAHQAGAYASMGVPLGDQDIVKKGLTNVGLTQRFSGGVMYYSSATGAQALRARYPDVTGRKSLLDEYEETYGGPTGVLGFPASAIKAITVTGPKGGQVGIYALDTSKGVLVWYPTVAGAGAPWGTTQPFTGLAVQLGNFKVFDDKTGCDNGPFCNPQDPYFKIQFIATGQPVKNIRIPTQGQYDNTMSVPINSNKGLAVPRVFSQTVISLQFDAWDQDDVFGDDKLGRVTKTLDISTGWGAFVTGGFKARNLDFQPEYAIQRSSDIQALLLKPQWRYNYQWAFRNFDTELLSYDQMADTFTGIQRDEFVLAHPFHAAFYKYVYSTIAKDGNCFGMALSSTYAQLGKSPYQAPLGLLGPSYALNGGHICTDGSKPCGPSNVAAGTAKGIVEYVNMLHGYQLNAIVGCRGLDLYKQMLATGFEVLTAHTTFADAESRHKSGDPQLISMAGDKVGHVIRAYRFLRDQADTKCPKLGVTKCHVMYVADPNNPYDSGEAANPDPDHLVVHPSNGRWYYTDKFNNLAPKRYALMNIPFSWVAAKSPAIVDDIPWGTVFDIAMLYIFGDADINGTDPIGNVIGSKDCLVTALPKPSDASRPIIILGPTTPRVYMMRRFQGTPQPGGGFTFQIKPSGNYSFGIKTINGAFMVDAPKGDGSVDVLSLRGFDTSPVSQAFSLAPGSAKSVDLSLTAPTRSAIDGPPLVYALSKLAALAGERIDSALLNAGQALQIGSSIAGRELQYDLRISRGVDQAGLNGAQAYPNLRPGPGTQLLVPKLLPQLVVQPGRKRSHRRAE